jgi:hypothetical protein
VCEWKYKKIYKKKEKPSLMFPMYMANFSKTAVDLQNPSPRPPLIYKTTSATGKFHCTGIFSKVSI